MKNFILIIIVILGLSSCDCNCNSECEDIACTEQFVMITVTIVDQDQNPIILDDYTVIDIDNNIDLTDDLMENYQSYPIDGTYPIFDDRYQSDYQNQEIELHFIAYINNQEVVNEYYSVGADCCHVYLFEGETVIQLEG